jgi:FixJ family two-component response regulator
MATPLVYIIDDDASVRAGVERLLRSAGYCPQSFPDTQQAFAKGRPASNCCLVLDLCVPGENGLAFQQRLAERGIRIPIIFITGHGEIASSVQAMKAGAVDFLTKPFEADDLLQAVSRALKADSEDLSHDQHQSELRKRFRTLTNREREVLAAVAAGLLNKQIAAELGIAEKTVKVHRAHAMDKMDAVAVTDAVRMADSLGLKWQSPQVTPEYSHYASSEL